MPKLNYGHHLYTCSVQGVGEAKAAHSDSITVGLGLSYSKQNSVRKAVHRTGISLNNKRESLGALILSILRLIVVQLNLERLLHLYNKYIYKW